MKKTLFIIIVSSFFTEPAIFSQSDFTEIQTFIDSNITRNFLLTTFDNTQLSANLQSKLNFYRTAKKLNYYIKNYYSSAVTKLHPNLFRDFDNVKTGVGYFITPDFNASVNYFGMFYSDEKNIQLKGTSSNMFYLGGLFDKTVDGADINAELKAGYKFEQQFDEHNNGMSLSGDLNVTNLNISGYYTDGQVKIGWENLNPRRNNAILARLNISKSFSDNLSSNEFNGYFSRIRKDFYFPADLNTQNQFSVNNNIEKRTEYILKAFDRFDYTISQKATLYITLNPYFRDIYKENYYIPVVNTTSPSIYDTEIQELSVGGEASLNFNFRKVTVQLKTSYVERDEKHFLINPDRIKSIFVKEKEELEGSKNNHSSKFQIGSNVYYNISLSSRLEFSGIASILKYDTPSINNNDDRDELNFIVYLGHIYNNLKNFQLSNSVDLSLYHTVYIFGERSSNNSWNRVIRFTSRSDFNPSESFRTINTFNVLANYTVYDFEDLISSVKSYSFRQFNVKDSTIYNFSDFAGIDMYAELKLYERGELNWRAFSLRPVNYFEDKIINAELNYFFNKFITLSAGYRYFEQKRFSYTDGNRVFSNAVKTYGPMAKFRVYLKDNSLVEIIASYDYYKYGNLLPSSANGNTYINVRWNF